MTVACLQLETLLLNKTVLFTLRAEEKIFINYRKVIWNVEANINNTEKRACTCPYEMLLHLFFSKTQKLTRVILVHIKFSTLSLPQKNRTFFFPVHTNRKNDITPASFSVTYPYADNEKNLALAVRTYNISCRFFVLVRCVHFSIQDRGTGSFLQLSRPVYRWETDAAWRHSKLSQKINSTTMVCGVVPVKWNVLTSTFGFPKSSSIYLKWCQTTKSLFSI
jgi:hypothetical protein